MKIWTSLSSPSKSSLILPLLKILGNCIKHKIMLFGYWTTGSVGMCSLREAKKEKTPTITLAFGLQALSVLCLREGEKQSPAVLLS